MARWRRGWGDVEGGGWWTGSGHARNENKACRNGTLTVDDLGLPASVVLVKGRFAAEGTLLGDGGVFWGRARMPICNCSSVGIPAVAVAELLCGRGLTRCMKANGGRLVLVNWLAIWLRACG